jgi:hypothetical protein
MVECDRISGGVSPNVKFVLMAILALRFWIRRRRRPLSPRRARFCPWSSVLWQLAAGARYLSHTSQANEQVLFTIARTSVPVVQLHIQQAQAFGAGLKVGTWVAILPPGEETNVIGGRYAMSNREL